MGIDIEKNKFDQNSFSDEMTLKDILFELKNWLNFLRSKFKIILLFGLIGGSIGILAAYLDKPKYKAVLTFALEDDKGGGGGGLSGALGLASSFGIDLGGVGGGGAFAAGNIAELMKSRLIVEKVLLKTIKVNGNETTLAEYYIDINKLRKNWENKPSLKKIKFIPNSDRSKYNLQQDSILLDIYRNLINQNNLNIFQKDKKVTILTIEVKSNNELFSKLFCESLAKETSEFYIETKSKKARINVNVLQNQVDSVRSELNGAIGRVALETDYVYNLNPAFNVKGAPTKRKQIDVQANTSILTNLVVQLELAKITLRKETPLIQLIDLPIFPLEKEKLGKLKSLIIGGLFASMISILYLSFKNFIKKQLSI